MSYFKKCPYCGSNNDPCEPCDCQKEKEDKKEPVKKTIYIGKEINLEKAVGVI